MSISLVPVFAQDGGTNGSPDNDKLIEDDFDDTDELKFVVTVYGDPAPYGATEITDILEAANTEIPAETPEGYTVVDLFDASVVRMSTRKIEPDQVVAFSVSEVDLTAYEDWYVLRRVSEGNWVKVDGATFENGVLSIPAVNLCAFAVLATKTSSSGGGEGTSPATGDNSAYFVLMAVVFAALAVVFVKKAVKNN